MRRRIGDMQAYMNGKPLNYSELTWEQLCDPALLVIDDGLPPYGLNQQAKADREAAITSLQEFCNQSYWVGDVMALGFVVLCIALLSGFIVLMSSL